MTHNDRGHYAAKHPKGAVAAIAIGQAVQERCDDQGITCFAAHQIAKELGVPPRDVGIAVDLLETRIRKCQLGLFGYGEPHKAVKPATDIAPDVKSAIEKSLIEGRLPCAEAWRIADSISMPRLELANYCEALNIRICRCQLGAFK